jgi:hypothetical protein
VTQELVSVLDTDATKMVPDYCAKTRKESVEPYATFVEELHRLVSLFPPHGEGHGKLHRMITRYGLQAYQEVDNPTYDAVACLTWKEKQMEGWG